MKKSPCLNCKYLSDDKGACMFLIHTGVPFVDPVEFYAEDEQAIRYPDECYALANLKDEMKELLDLMERQQAEITNTWEQIQVLEEELEANK